MTTIRPLYQITRHPIGSVKEIWSISWPLIMGLLSNGLMIIVDRFMLGRYSLEAMNAATTASAAAFSFFILPMVVAGISEVFVGRYHGQGKNQKMGPAVWQMVWFSALLGPFFILCGAIFGPVLFKDTVRPDYALSYFYVIINFGSMFCINPALMGFFIGQGKVRIITITVAVANIFNFVLDYALIFGTPFSAPMGVKGAAVATVLSQFILASVYLISFLKSKNRKEKGTADWGFKKRLFVKSLKVGIPASFAHLAEFVSYFFFLRFMGSLGGYFLTIAILLNTVYMTSYFVIEGMSKGVTAICSNLIGVQKHELVKKNIFSACQLHLIFVAVFSAVMLLGAPGIYSVFIGKADKAILLDPVFLNQMYIATIYMCLFYLFDGAVWVFVGLLTASGDTKFIMLVGTFAPCLLFFLPIYLIGTVFNITPKEVWLISAIYGFLHLGIYWLRYRAGVWKASQFREDPSIPMQEG